MLVSVMLSPRSAETGMQTIWVRPISAAKDRYSDSIWSNTSWE